MSPDDILLEAEEKMIKTEQVVLNEFAGVRTGKASASLSKTSWWKFMAPRCASANSPASPRPNRASCWIQPWDMTSIQAIEKAIQKANLGLSPAVQGKRSAFLFPN